MIKQHMPECRKKIYLTKRVSKFSTKKFYEINPSFFNTHDQSCKLAFA
jgi:hypothetical protein